MTLIPKINALIKAVRPSPRDIDLHLVLADALEDYGHLTEAVKQRLIALMLSAHTFIEQIITTCPTFCGTLAGDIALQASQLVAGERESNIGILARKFCSPDEGECQIAYANDSPLFHSIYVQNVPLLATIEQHEFDDPHWMNLQMAPPNIHSVHFEFAPPPWNIQEGTEKDHESFLIALDRLTAVQTALQNIMKELMGPPRRIP